MTDSNRTIAVFDQGKLVTYDLQGKRLQQMPCHLLAVTAMWSLLNHGYLMQNTDGLWVLPIKQKRAGELYKLAGSADLYGHVACAPGRIAVVAAAPHNIAKIWYAEASGHFTTQAHNVVMAPSDAKLQFMAPMGDQIVGVSSAQRGYDRMSFAAIVADETTAPKLFDLGNVGRPLFFHPWSHRYTAYGNHVLDFGTKTVLPMGCFQALLLGAFPLQNDTQIITHSAVPLPEANGRYRYVDDRLEFFDIKADQVHYSGTLDLGTSSENSGSTRVLPTSENEFVAVMSPVGNIGEHSVRAFSADGPAA